MENKKKIDDAVMKALNAKEIRRLICITDKGNLDLVIRKGENNYFLSIDSVPLDKEVNDKLMGILFATPIPQVDKEPKAIAVDHPKGIGSDLIEVKKKGGPAKVK